VAPGDVLARRYRLESLLGWGGIAVVFQARDVQAPGSKQAPPAPLAVKVVRADLAPDALQDALANLRWEAHLLRRLRHPALPRLARFYSDQHTAWIAREMVTGTSLEVWAGRVPCDPQTVLGWALQLCDLLRYMHTQSPPVICGDIKPANLLMRPDGRLALVDMGAAHTLTQRPPRRPRPHYGTPGYAPPEQLGRRGIDERSDLFSLGVLCYELLTGLDPTTAPLQFHLPHLDHVAPHMALALRWALALEPQQRAPTAAALRAALLPADTPPAPLDLGYRVRVNSQQELLDAAMRHPRLLEQVYTSGKLDNWLATHPDRALGALLHNLRIARREAPARQRAIDTFFMALSPTEGSALLQTAPDCIVFGAVPLRRWGLWSAPQRLMLHNTAPHPLRWELDCPAQIQAEVRVLANGRPVRHTQGVLPPGGREDLALVAAGRQGQRHGTLTLRCGLHTSHIAWEATVQPGIPVGRAFAASLQDLDLAQPDLLHALEALLSGGVLPRWLRAQGKRKQAAEFAAAINQPLLTTLERRLVIARLLHPLDPQRFPLLNVRGGTLPRLSMVAGSTAKHTLEIQNSGASPCRVTWQSRCPWARIESKRGAVTLPPGGHMPLTVVLSPPAALSPGQHEAALELWAGSLMLPVVLTVQVTAKPWWQRVLGWFSGG
jgi:serine/threonine protein kinase